MPSQPSGNFSLLEIEMIVVYMSDGEMIVTTSKMEVATVKEYFTDGGRDLNDYDREVYKEAFAITPRLHIR